MLRSLYDASVILSHRDRGSGGFSELYLAVQGEAIMRLSMWLGARIRSASQMQNLLNASIRCLSKTSW